MALYTGLMGSPRVNAFKEKDVAPTAVLEQAALGSTYDAYAQTMSNLEAAGLELEWAFYRDGGWLQKCLDGRKNVAWICVNEGVATVACYIPTRHCEELLSLDLPTTLLDEVRALDVTKKSLPVIIELRSSVDARAASELVAFKRGLK